MARKIEQLSDEEKTLILNTIFHQMYAEDTKLEGDTITFQLDPDKDVNGGDLVDLISHLFRQHNLVPARTMDKLNIDEYSP